MEFRDALKLFRSEVGIAQTDVATALHINISTVARWEQGKNVPTRSFAVLLLNYAKSKHATDVCIANLENALRITARQKLFNKKNSLYTVEHETISQLIEDAAFPIYVCDLETDEILYANRATEEQLGRSLDELTGKKCYECIMRRNKPCEFCHKKQMTEGAFGGYEAFRRFDGRYYRVFGKLAKWNGRPAQVRYMFELSGSVQIASKDELQLKYEAQLSVRRQNAGDALAIAHYNLTDGTASQVEYRDETLAKLGVMRRYEDIIQIIEANVFTPDEKKKLDCICNRESLIRRFFQGKTHISIKHRVKGFAGYFDDTFDLFQNPLTYDVEAFVTLRDATDEVVSDAVSRMLLHGGFDSIAAIDAATGAAHSYRGKHIDEVIKEQQRQGDNAAGVASYLRMHCSDSDIARVVRETSLPFILEQLQTKPVLSVAYSLRIDGQLLHKQAQFSYLDDAQTTVLCVTQDITDAYRQLTAGESMGVYTNPNTADAVFTDR